MGYIHSFLQKIKDTGINLWNSVIGERKVGKYMTCYVMTAAVFVSGLGIIRSLPGKAEGKTKEVETVTGENSGCFISASMGQLIGVSLTKLEEAPEGSEQDSEEVLVLFGMESEITEPRLFLPVAGTGLFAAETAVTENRTVKTSISAEFSNLTQPVRAVVSDETETAEVWRKETLRREAAQAELAEKKAAAKKAAASVKTTGTKKTSSGSDTTKETKASAKKSKTSSASANKTGTRIAETVKKTDLEDGLLLTYNSKLQLSLTEEEVEILERIVEAEATDEDIYGKVLVADVVLNRVLSSGFPDTVKEVVFQKGQFSPIRDGRYYSVKVTSSTKEAVERALAGEDYSDGALFFFARKRTTAKKASWFDNSLERLFRYGGHEFFKNK